jgi:plastocyanin
MKIFLAITIIFLLAILNFSNMSTHEEPMSPLQQFKSGVTLDHIVCKSNFQLIVKMEDQSPACVKSQTVQKLVERGWAMTTLPNISTNTNLSTLSSGKCITGNPTFSVDLVSFISIQKNASNPSSGKSYYPQITTVMIGINNTIGWMNEDNSASSVTSDDGSFDSGPILPGPDHIWKHKFDCAGTYEYHSEPHPWMKGTVVVLPYDKSQ